VDNFRSGAAGWPSPWGRDWAGRWDHHLLTSEVLKGNQLGDPVERPLSVYLPPGYDDEPDRRYPVVYVIQGYTGQLDMWWNRAALRPNLPELLDRAFAEDGQPPALVVLADAWTSLGGSQFLNSPGTGRYMDHLCDEVTAFVDERYRTLPDRDHRALAGKSSGGYGAMVVPMLRPDVFGALASHAGDALFEACYLQDFPVVVRALRDHYDGSYERFWEEFRSRPAFAAPSDDQLAEVWCMAACYSAEPDGTVTLPFDPRTGRLRDEVWERWLALDPVRMAAGHADALRSMRGIWLDAGTRDEYWLDLGARAFADELDALGVGYELELFEAGHGGIEYRYPLAITWLARRLAG
jgi:S-formylglutathione hydrolase FrmB